MVLFKKFDEFKLSKFEISTKTSTAEVDIVENNNEDYK